MAQVTKQETSTAKRSLIGKAGLDAMAGAAAGSSQKAKRQLDFPTQAEIEIFQNQLTVEIIQQLHKEFNTQKSSSYAETVNAQLYRKIMKETFRDKPPGESLLVAIYDRFRPFRFKNEGEDFELVNAVDVLDLMLGLNFLSRNKIDGKIKLMFKLCDSDDDGCMNPVDILQMLQRVERVFCRERARVQIESQILLNKNADQKAEKNFHFIMSAIRSQNQKKEWKKQIRVQVQEEKKNMTEDNHRTTKEIKASIAANAGGFDISAADQKEDDLITYREFMTALKSLKDTLYKKLIPRTLAFSEVLQSRPYEETYEISDVAYDDFMMFRYEMQTIFEKHKYTDEKRNDPFLLGSHPLSKRNGRMIKDMREDEKKNCMDMYCPPGIVRCKATKIGQVSKISKEIKRAIPQSEIFIRDAEEHRPAMGDNMNALGKQSNMFPTEKKPTKEPARDLYGKKKEEANVYQSLIDNNQVGTHTKKANDINFEEMFKDHLPPEAVDLADFVKDLSNKNVSKGKKDIENWKKEGATRLKFAENLLPQGDDTSIRDLWN